MRVDGRDGRTIWLNEDGASVDVIDQKTPWARGHARPRSSRETKSLHE